MNKATIAILTLLCVFAFSYFSALNISEAHTYKNQDQERYWARLTARNAEERTEIANKGISIEVVNKDDVVVMVSKEELEDLKKTGRVQVSFALKPTDFPQEDSRFHNYNELLEAIDNLAALHPDIVSISSFGSSLELRQIPLITLGKNQNDPSVPAIFFVGGHHAREHLSVELPLMIAQGLARGWNQNDQRIRHLLTHRTVYIVPQLNPDGAAFDIETGRYRSWRKNRRANQDNSIGVDLNRNYGHRAWGTVGASKNPRSDTYHGPSPFSEPETQAVRDFISERPQITIVHSFHTFSELILYPWGHTSSKIQNQRDFQVHRIMAEKMATWNNYKPQQSAELYLTSGDTCDWAYGEMNRICFTTELDPRSQNQGGFYPGQEKIDIVFRKNWNPALYLIDFANNPYRVLEPSHKNYGLESALVQ